MKKKVIGILAVFALGAALYGGSLLNRGFSARDEPSLPETLAAHTARSLATPMRVRKMANPYAPTPDTLAEARINYAQNCALCHGNNGSGDTPIGHNLYPKPPDLRLSATQSQTDGELYAIIQNGIRLTGMPAWGEVRDDDRDRWNLVGFIRHMPTLTQDELNE